HNHARRIPERDGAVDRRWHPQQLQGGVEHQERHGEAAQNAAGPDRFVREFRVHASPPLRCVLTRGLPDLSELIRAPKKNQGSWSGRPKRGNSSAVSRKKVIPAIWSGLSSRTSNDQGDPSDLYWPKAGAPEASTGMRRESRQPSPRPSIQARMAS